MYEIIKDNNFEEFYKVFKSQKLIKTLGELRDFLNYRTYYKVEGDGTIKKKDINMALVNLILVDSEEGRSEDALRAFFQEGIFFKENQKLKKINRLSSYSLEVLDKNLYKIYYNRDLASALRYSKEYFLKDKERFKKKLLRYVLLDRVESKKTLLLLAMLKLINQVEDDNDLDTVLHIFINYIVRYPSVFEYTRPNGENKELDLYALSYKKCIELLAEESKEYEDRLEAYIQGNYQGKINESIYERLSD